MGFLDRVLGGGRGREAPAPAEEAAQVVPETPAPAATTPELTQDVGASTYGPPQLDLHGVAASSALPGLATMAGAGATPAGPSGRVYDPYEGISAAMSVRKHAFRLPSQPEFVFEEEAAVKRRGWNENLQFYTGIGYLGGGIAGVSAGLYSFATVKPEQPITSLKLQANRLLNLAGSRAKPFSNSAAILGLFFSSFESYLNSQVEQYDVPEGVSTITAGALAGALFRAPRGPRQSAAAAAVGAVMGLAVGGLRTIFPSL